MRTAAIYSYSAMPNNEAIRRQRKQCEALARTLRHQATVVFTDQAGDRTALRALLDHAAAGRIDAAVTWHIDRFGRQPLDLIRVLDTLAQAGVEVHTVTGGRIDATDHHARRIATVMVRHHAQSCGSPTNLESQAQS